MHDADLVHFRFPYDAISFPSCYNLTWELGQTRCSCSNSTHRCSSSEPKHRHWSRCSHYQQQQGFQQYLFIFAHALRKLYCPIGAWAVCRLRRTISILRSLRLLGFGFPIKRPPYHRVSCRSDHRKRGQTRCSGPNTTHRSPRTEPKHRHWSRGPHYQQQQG